MRQKAERILELLQQEGTVFSGNAAARLKDALSHDPEQVWIPSWLAEAAEETVARTEEQRRQAAVEAICTVLDDEEIHYDREMLRPEIPSFHMVYRIGSEQIIMRIIVESDPDVCRIDIRLPVECPKEFVSVLFDVIQRENFQMRFGGLRYDHRDGEVIYGYSYPIGGGILAEDFRMVYGAVLSSAVHGYRQIQKKLSYLTNEQNSVS